MYICDGSTVNGLYMFAAWPLTYSPVQQEGVYTINTIDYGGKNGRKQYS